MQFKCRIKIYASCILHEFLAFCSQNSAVSNHPSKHCVATQCRLMRSVKDTHTQTEPPPKSVDKSVCTDKTNLCSTSTQVHLELENVVLSLASNIQHLPQLFKDIVDVVQQYSGLSGTVSLLLRILNLQELYSISCRSRQF